MFAVDSVQVTKHRGLVFLLFFYDTRAQSLFTAFKIWSIFGQRFGILGGYSAAYLDPHGPRWQIIMTY